MRLIDADKLIEVMKNDEAFDSDELELIVENIENAPTAYDIDKVVEELESFAKLAEDRYVNGTSGKFALAEAKCWVKAIEIVRQIVR